jgi:hypothetical protein
LSQQSYLGELYQRAFVAIYSTDKPSEKVDCEKSSKTTFYLKRLRVSQIWKTQYTTTVLLVKTTNTPHRFVSFALEQLLQMLLLKNHTIIKRDLNKPL